MNFEWDENKNQINIEKHGLNFNLASNVFEGEIFTFEDDRFSYGEQRFITLGLLNIAFFLLDSLHES